MLYSRSLLIIYFVYCGASSPVFKEKFVTKRPGCYIPPCRIASGELLCSAVSSAGCSAMTYRSGKEAQEGGYACTHVGDSICCTAETNNIIKQLYSN